MIGEHTRVYVTCNYTCMSDLGYCTVTDLHKRYGYEVAELIRYTLSKMDRVNVISGPNWEYGIDENENLLPQPLLTEAYARKLESLLQIADRYPDDMWVSDSVWGDKIPVDELRKLDLVPNDYDESDGELDDTYTDQSTKSED
jgi:hypothetical protein